MKILPCVHMYATNVNNGKRQISFTYANEDRSIVRDRVVTLSVTTYGKVAEAVSNFHYDGTCTITPALIDIGWHAWRNKRQA